MSFSSVSLIPVVGIDGRRLALAALLQAETDSFSDRAKVTAAVCRRGPHRFDAVLL